MKKAILSLSMLALGCGSSPPPKVDTAENKGTLRPVTQGQLKLAHFSTADGMAGFVLDRTGDKPKMRVDGEKDIVELTVEEDRERGDLRGHFFRAPDGKKKLYLTESGSMTWYTGKDERQVNSDKPADPLPAATVTGTYVAPPSASEVLSKELTAISVRQKNPQMKAEDASHLSKIAEAFASADAAMWVTFSRRGETSFLPTISAGPSSLGDFGYGRSEFVTDEEEDKRHTKSAKYGARVRGFSQPKHAGNHIIVELREHDPRLSEGMPGLVWEVVGTTAVFVSLDGGRYEVSLANPNKGPILQKGVMAESTWPKPVQDPFMDISFISRLSKAGALPEKVVSDLSAIDQEWNTCAQKVWKGAEVQIDKKGSLSAFDMKEWSKKVTKSCQKSLDKYESLTVELVEKRERERKELFEKMKGRVSGFAKK